MHQKEAGTCCAEAAEHVVRDRALPTLPVRPLVLRGGFTQGQAQGLRDTTVLLQPENHQFTSCTRLDKQKVVILCANCKMVKLHQVAGRI